MPCSTVQSIFHQYKNYDTVANLQRHSLPTLTIQASNNNRSSQDGTFGGAAEIPNSGGKISQHNKHLLCTPYIRPLTMIEVARKP